MYEIENCKKNQQFVEQKTKEELSEARARARMSYGLSTMSKQNVQTKRRTVTSKYHNESGERTQSTDTNWMYHDLMNKGKTLAQITNSDCNNSHAYRV